MAKAKVVRYPKTYTLWNRALESIDVALIEKMRVDLKVPKEGFTDKVECEKWNEMQWDEYRDLFDEYNCKIPKEIENQTLFMKKRKYLNEIINTLDDDRLKKGFLAVALDFLFFKNIHQETYLKANGSGCEIEIIRDNTERCNIESGFYIKIGKHSNVQDIKNFLNQEGKLIKSILEENYTEKGVKYQEFARNKVIKLVSKMNKKDLKEKILSINNNPLDIVSNRKDQLALRYLKLYYGIKITEENYRSTIIRI